MSSPLGSIRWMVCIGTLLCSLVSAGIAQDDVPQHSRPTASLETGNDQFVFLDVYMIERIRVTVVPEGQQQPFNRHAIPDSSREESAPSKATNQATTFESSDMAEWLRLCQDDPEYRVVSRNRLKLKLGEKGHVRKGKEYPLADEFLGDMQLNKEEQKVAPLFVGTNIEATVTNSRPGVLYTTLVFEYSEPTGHVSAPTDLPVADFSGVQTGVSSISGQTTRVSNLVAVRSFDVANRVPLLGHLPGVGQKWFSPVKHQQVVQERIVLVTANINE